MSTHQKSKIENQKPARGFTLTEILLVVAIIAMVGGLGSGYAVGTYKKLLVEKAARHFLLMARYARVMAIEQHRPYELQIDPNNRGFFLTTTQANPQTGDSERIVVRDFFCKPVQFEGQVQFEDVQMMQYGDDRPGDAGMEQKIVFLPNGSAESAVLQIGDGRTHYSIAVVAATGKASLYPGPAQEIRTASVDLDLQGMGSGK